MLVRKTVTVLFSDVVTSTELGERLDPESLRQVMTRWFEEMRTVIERHGGTIEKFIGDEVMAVYGVPVVHEDDALRAVRAAGEMRDRLETLNEELEAGWGIRLQARTGINTGEVVAGDPATAQTFVTGEPVVLAKRLEQAAAPGEILIGKATYPLVKDAVSAGPLESFPVKGKAQPVVPWRLDEVEAGVPGLARRLDAPLVDRLEELERLREAFERAEREESCQLVTALGPAGIGKSRLAGELVASVGDRATALTGRCLPYGDGITFWPLVQLIREAGGDETLDEILRDVEDADVIKTHVRAAIGAAPVAGGSAETFWAVRRFLEELARRRPLVLVLEDIHWAEPTFLDLLEYVAGFSQRAPLLVVCLARLDLLELQPTWMTPRPNASVLSLEPLSEPDAAELLTGLHGQAELGAETRGQIAAAAEGNPLFIEQMVAMALEHEDGESPVPIPPSIQALLAERLDRLSAGERVVLERAAVVGKEFPGRALAELCPSELRPTVGQLLLSLVRKELIRPDTSRRAGDDAFRFRHVLIRDAAYDGLPKEVRAELHERVAGWIEERTGTRARELEEITGYHLEQAFLHRAQLGPVDESARALSVRAAERLASAGRRAFARGDVRAAVGLLTRATILLRDEDEARIELAPDLAAALAETGELARAEAILERATDDAETSGNRRVEWHARIGRLLVRVRTEPDTTGELVEEAERAVAIFEELDDQRGLALAWRGLSAVHWMASRWGARTAALEQALVHARSAGDRREEAIALGSLGLSLYWGPTPADAAVARCRAILDEAKGDRTVEGRMLAVLAGLHAMQGRFDESRELYARSRSLLDELGLPLLVGTHTLVRGSAELLAGDPEAAEHELRFGCELLERIGERAALSTLIAVLAEAVYAQGRLVEADRLTLQSAEATSADDVANQTLWRSTRGKILADRGELGQGEALAREAVALASTTDALNLHADALAALAAVLDGTPDAAAALRDAAGLYEAKGNTVSAAKARAELERLETTTRAGPEG